MEGERATAHTRLGELRPAIEKEVSRKWGADALQQLDCDQHLPIARNPPHTISVYSHQRVPSSACTVGACRPRRLCMPCARAPAAVRTPALVAAGAPLGRAPAPASILNRERLRGAATERARGGCCLSASKLVKFCRR